MAKATFLAALCPPKSAWIKLATGPIFFKVAGRVSQQNRHFLDVLNGRQVGPERSEFRTSDRTPTDLPRKVDFVAIWSFV